MLQFLCTSRHTIYSMCLYSLKRGPLFRSLLYGFPREVLMASFRGTQVATHTPYICKSIHIVFVYKSSLYCFPYHIKLFIQRYPAHNLLKQPKFILYFQSLLQQKFKIHKLSCTPIYFVIKIYIVSL